MNLIDRDKALSFPFANGNYDHEHADTHFIFGCEMYREWLEGLPVVEPERKRGKWTVTSLFIKCSECGEPFMLIPQNYCPHCGADMREENE